MKLELHFLQNFAPSNLNRDDTGAPKDCEFGGHRRARISSQCLKRAVRQAFSSHRLFGEDTDDLLAARTKRLVDEAAHLLGERGRDEREAQRLVAFALQSAKLKVDDERKTQYLLFVPRRTVKRLAELVERYWDALATALPAPDAALDGDKGKPKAVRKGKGAEKSAGKDAVPKEIARDVETLLSDVSRTPDLALFGRMIADQPEWNTDAACQVAHAISTNRASMEFDFFTAVDDLRQKDTTGSDMMGTVMFGSACFYRYACLDVDALRENLGGTGAEAADLTRRTIEAFLRASALAIPTGKQNSMAAQNLPSYLLAVVRRDGAPLSLANAFVRPVHATAEADLVEASIAALEGYLDRAFEMWGDEGLTLLACSESETTGSKRPRRVPRFEDWVRASLAAVDGSPQP
jgi:CRISPR system Cascade subunit CasC